MQPRIVTARYNNPALKDQSKYALVRTSVGVPRWPLPNPIAFELLEAAPLSSWLKLNKDAYSPLYVERVKQRRGEWWYERIAQLEKQAGGRVLALCCFEDLRNTDNWCHRRLFAEVVDRWLGIEIPELAEPEPEPKVKPKKEPVQGSLF